MRRRKLLVVLALLAVVLAAGAIVLWPREDRITQENFERIQPGTSRADLESLLGPGPRALLRAREMQSVINMDNFAEVHVSQLRVNQTLEGADRLVWTGRDGVIVVTYTDGQDVSKIWLRRANLFERIKRQWQRWFP